MKGDRPGTSDGASFSQKSIRSVGSAGAGQGAEGGRTSLSGESCRAPVGVGQVFEPYSWLYGADLSFFADSDGQTKDFRCLNILGAAKALFSLCLISGTDFGEYFRHYPGETPSRQAVRRRLIEEM